MLKPSMREWKSIIGFGELVFFGWLAIRKYGETGIEPSCVWEISFVGHYIVVDIFNK
jgi:hypothetical protein